MIRTTLAVAIAALLLVPAADAQSLTDPATTHVEQKKNDAQQDPVGFATSHASEQAVADEAAWSVAYTCFVVDTAHDDHGTPDPDLEQCEDYEEVLGIEEEDPVEEPVAQVENLTEDPVAQVDELGDDAAATVERILADPTTAADEILAFLERLLGRVRALIDGVAALVGESLAEVPALAEALAAALRDLIGIAGVALAADAKMGSGLYVTAIEGADLAFDAAEGAARALGTGTSAMVAATGDAIASAASAVADFIGETAGAVGRAVGSSLEAVADAADAMADGIGDFLDRIFGSSSSREDVSDRVRGGDVDDAADDLLGRVPCVDCLLRDSV